MFFFLCPNCGSLNCFLFICFFHQPSFFSWSCTSSSFLIHLSYTINVSLGFTAFQTELNYYLTCTIGGTSVDKTCPTTPPLWDLPRKTASLRWNMSKYQNPQKCMYMWLKKQLLHSRFITINLLQNSANIELWGCMVFFLS